MPDLLPRPIFATVQRNCAGWSCTQRNGICVGYHCPYCGGPSGGQGDGCIDLSQPEVDERRRKYISDALLQAYHENKTTLMETT